MLAPRKTLSSALAGLVLCLAACSSKGSTVDSGATAQPPAAPRGSRTVACVQEEAHAQATDTPTANDLTIGPITWPGLKNWSTADPKDFAGGTPGDYKVGAVVKAGAVVTVSVAAPSKDEAGLKYGQRWSYSPTRSITFQGCKEFDTAYFGGFHITDRKCLPLDIEESGKPPIRVSVSFFAGPCQNQ